MTDTADLVKAVATLNKAITGNTAKYWDYYCPVKTVLAALSTLQAELAEAKRENEELQWAHKHTYNQGVSWMRRAESAESSLAQASERVKELEGLYATQTQLAQLHHDACEEAEAELQKAESRAAAMREALEKAKPYVEDAVTNWKAGNFKPLEVLHVIERALTKE